MGVAGDAVIYNNNNNNNNNNNIKAAPTTNIIKKNKKKPRIRKSNHPKSLQQSPPHNHDNSPIIHVVVSSSDDDEADADLSLKIVQKSILRNCSNSNSNSASSAANTLSSPPPSKQVKKKKVKNKKPSTFIPIPTKQHADVVNDSLLVEDVETKEEGDAPKEIDMTVETKEEGDASKETDMTVEMDPSEKSDNIVLRQLLRGPRYFDPPDNSWGNCYNCGEGGHAAANCTSAKRKKPCFVCGSLEHNVKECTKGKDCFICKKTGHRAKDCPEKSNWKSQNAKICLKCGDSGHEMFSCKNEYSPDDLKEIQCYVCKCFGHLCCVDYGDEGPREVSCYRCGQLGHSGWECASLHAETSQATNTGTPSSCYKCGEGGHIARKCTSSTKKQKRKSEYSSPGKKNTYGNHIGVRSVPPDFGNARKRNKTHHGQASPSQPKPRGRGGWINEDPGDYSNNHDWGSPKTPSRYRSNDRFHGGNGYKSNDRYHGGNGYQSNDRFYGGNGYNSNDGFHGRNAYKSHDRYHGGGSYNSGYHSNGRRFDYGNVVGSNGYQQTFSASRYGNSSSYGKREYGW